MDGRGLLISIRLRGCAAQYGSRGTAVHRRPVRPPARSLAVAVAVDAAGAVGRDGVQSGPCLGALVHTAPVGVRSRGRRVVVVVVVGLYTYRFISGWKRDDGDARRSRHERFSAIAIFVLCDYHKVLFVMFFLLKGSVRARAGLCGEAYGTLDETMGCYRLIWVALLLLPLLLMCCCCGAMCSQQSCEKSC